MLTGRTTLFLRGALFAALLVASGCQTAMPVQEMSDARQAIMAAKEAGAQQHAADDLKAAEGLLQSAEENLTTRNYAVARRDAVEAKTRAIDALKLSEASQEADN